MKHSTLTLEGHICKHCGDDYTMTIDETGYGDAIWRCRCGNNRSQKDEDTYTESNVWN